MPQYEGTYINPDLTKEQRKQDYLLRQQLREMRTTDPQNSYKIYRGKVVQNDAERRHHTQTLTLDIDYHITPQR